MYCQYTIMYTILGGPLQNSKKQNINTCIIIQINTKHEHAIDVTTNYTTESLVELYTWDKRTGKIPARSLTNT